MPWDRPNESPLIFHDKAHQMLACAALQPGLRTILVFDAQMPAILEMANVLQKYLSIVISKPIKPIILGITAQDDDLWGCYKLNTNTGSEAEIADVYWGCMDGILSQNANALSVKIIIIPDLSMISTAAARAFISVIDTPEINVERHGLSAKWHPSYIWLASCRRNDIGKISPHILERFALRIQSPNVTPSDSIHLLVEMINQDDIYSLPGGAYDIDVTEQQQLVTANKSHPHISGAAISRVFDYFPNKGGSSRREIALARLAVARAQLLNTERVEVSHVDMAAIDLGLSTYEDKTPEKWQNHWKEHIEQKDEPDEYQIQDTPITMEVLETPSLTNDNTNNQGQVVIDSGEENTLEPVDGGLVTEAYAWPEDFTEGEYEATPLRFPYYQTRSEVSERGVIIGVKRSQTIKDLALVRTLFEAVKFQYIRKKNDTLHDRQLIILPEDLRSYIRLRIPDNILLILIDYTSLTGCEWQEAMLPYLQWAYVNRASVRIIQVGEKHAKNELRAESITAKSILNPYVSRAFESRGGRASPLAHGLELLYQNLLSIQNQGNKIITKPVVLIVTDGRGNVPLRASWAGEIHLPVRREGIDDAMEMAKKLREFRNVRFIFFDPQPQQYKELPMQLSTVLGSIHVKIPLPKEISD